MNSIIQLPCLLRRSPAIRSGSSTAASIAHKLSRYAFVLFTLLAVNFSAKSAVVSITVDNLKYNVDTDTKTATVTGPAVDEIHDLVIPDYITYDGVEYPVTTIGDFAFYSCGGFTGELIIPSSVTTIGVYAFAKCSGFTGDLIIPNSVTEIGGYAFSGCSGFTVLAIPNSVTSIGAQAFYEMSGIGKVKYISERPIEAPKNIFSDEIYKNAELEYLESSINLYQSTMPWYMFQNMNVLNIIDGIRYIIDEETQEAAVVGPAFEEIQDLVIPDYITRDGVEYAVTSIGGYAFSECKGLIGTLTIGNNIKIIGEKAFYLCENLRGDLVIPNSVTSIGESAFAFSGFNGDLTIGESLTVISSRAFESNNFRGKLTIGSSVTKICDRAFQYNRWLTGDLIIPNSVIEIEEGAFWECNRFDGKLVIGNSVKTIGPTVFYDCTNLKGSLEIPNSVTTIGSMAFLRCSGFTGNLRLPNSIKEIGPTAFSGCSGLTGVTIPNSVTKIEGGTFYNCSGFTGDLIIPETVDVIGGQAFKGCSGLTGNIVIPNLVVEIGVEAFNGIENISTVSYQAEKPIEASKDIFSDVVYENAKLEALESSIGLYRTTMPWSLFRSINTDVESDELTYDLDPETRQATLTGHTADDVESLVIPSTIIVDGVEYTVTAIGDGAFMGCENLSGDLTIPNTVTTIGRQVFKGCTWLNGCTITLPASLKSIGEGAFDFGYGSRAQSVGKLICEAVEPPVIDGAAFSDDYYVSVPLYVPEESVDAYAVAPDWSRFASIKDLASSGIEGVAAGEGVTITTRGREIHVAGLDEDAVVTVYDLSGRQVYAGRERVIGPLNSGVYVVDAGGKRHKIKL